MKRYFYKEKRYYYFGFEEDQNIMKWVKGKIKAKYNPANKEWYVEASLFNLPLIQDLIKQYNFVEMYPQRKREIELSPFETIVKPEDLKPLIADLEFNKVPRYYQLEAIAYLINHGNCINGSDVGLGKTFETILFLEIMDFFPCIITCPATVKTGWEKEWKALNPSRSVSIIWSGKENNWNADVTIINYDLLGEAELFEDKKTGKKVSKVEVKFDILKQRKYQAIVGDEIHFLKNPKAIRSKAFKKISKTIPNIYALSGSLILNRPSELNNILTLIKKQNDIFSDWEYFHYRYCNMKITPYGRDTKSSCNVKELFEILSHYCYIRKEKRDVLTELPPIIEQVIEVEISNSKIYRSAEKDLIKYLEEIDLDKMENALRAEVLVKMSTLSSLSIQGKMKEIEKYVKEWLESNEEQKLLVFGIHKDPLKKLHDKFKDSCLITGDTSASQKEEQKNLFINDPEKRVLFANIDCIGTGVDGLQYVCSNGLIMELPKQPGTLVQAIGRLERMGQKNSINLVYILSPETTDVLSVEMLNHKKGITDYVCKGYRDNDTLKFLKQLKSWVQ